VQTSSFELPGFRRWLWLLVLASLIPARESAAQQTTTPVMSRAFDFVKKRMRNPDGGVFTNYLDTGFEDEVYVYGHNVTSEHMGLMLLVSAAMDARTAFEESYRYVSGRMISARKRLVFWAIDKRTGRPLADTEADLPYYNSPLDDFRVVNGLIAGFEHWGDDRYLALATSIGAALFEHSVDHARQFRRYEAGLVTNGYTWSETTGEGMLQADIAPINYADLWTMRWLASHDARWLPVIESAASLMEASQIPKSGQFYNTYYPDGRFAGDWEYQPSEVDEDAPPARKVKTIQSLWTAIHLARIGRKAAPTKALTFYKTQYEKTGRIAEYYNYDGTEPKESYFNDTLRQGEARIYAQLTRLAYYLGDRAFADRLVKEKLEPDQVNDARSPLDGYIGKSTAEVGDADAFNVLESILGLAIQQDAPAVTHVFAP
jgi:hypothetical protein